MVTIVVIRTAITSTLLSGVTKPNGKQTRKLQLLLKPHGFTAIVRVTMHWLGLATWSVVPLVNWVSIATQSWKTIRRHATDAILRWEEVAIVVGIISTCRTRTPIRTFMSAMGLSTAADRTLIIASTLSSGYLGMEMEPHHTMLALLVWTSSERFQARELVSFGSQARIMLLIQMRFKCIVIWSTMRVVGCW